MFKHIILTNLRKRQTQKLFYLDVKLLTIRKDKKFHFP